MRIGAVSAVLGGLGWIFLLLFHGDLPSDPEAALHYVASRPYWSALHLEGIFSVLLWSGAFIALAGSMEDGAGRVLGWLGVASVVVGTAVVVVDFSIDGVAFKALADAWENAPSTRQVNLELSFDTLLQALGGTFFAYKSFLLGLPFVLLGLAVAVSRAYPTWLGWIGALVGSGSLVAGTTGFVGLDLVPDWLFFAVFTFVESFWLVVMGILMWRRASTDPESANETVTRRLTDTPQA